MMEIDQFIVLILEEKAEEMERFKDFIQNSESLDQEIPYEEWKNIYLEWALQREEVPENIKKIPRILLSNDYL